MDTSQLKEKVSIVVRKVSYYCKKGYNKSKNLCNYLNKEFKERWSSYETISEDQEPLLSDESRNDTHYYQYEPDNVPVQTERPKTLSNIFNSVSHAFRSYYSDASNESIDENLSHLDSSSSDSDSNSPEHGMSNSRKSFLSMKKVKIKVMKKKIMIN